MAGAKNEAKIKFNADCKEFNQQIKSANASLKELRSEIALNATQLKNGGDEVSLLNEQFRLLQDAVVSAGDKVEAMRGKVEAAVRNYGEGSDEVAKWRAELANAEAQEEKLTQQLEDCANAIGRYIQEQQQSETATAKINASIRDQSETLEHLKAAYVDAALEYGKNSDEAQTLARQIESLSGELQENQNRLSDAERAADSFDHTLDNLDDGVADVSGALSTLGGYIDGFDSAVTNVVTGAMREFGQVTKEVGGAIIETGMQTEYQFAKVQALSESTDAQMEVLKNRALEVQGTLPVTLQDCGKAMEYMALAGWDAEEMQNALYPVMTLVVASGEDLSRVCDIVTDDMTAMGMTSDETTHFVDVFAQTMRSSNTDIDKLGDTMKYFAPLAYDLNFSLEDVALASGLMANQGIKAGQAGTAMRQAFKNLVSPTDDMAAAMDVLGISLTDSEGNAYGFLDLMVQLRYAFNGFDAEIYDSDGNLRDYEDILADVTKSGKDYTQVEKLKAASTIFGTRAMSGMLAVINTAPEKFDELVAKIYDYDGAAEEMAGIMQDTLQGDVDMLNTSLDTLANRIFDNASPALRELVQTLNDWVNSDESVELIDDISGELTELLEGALNNLPEILDTTMGILQGVPAAIGGVSSAIQWVGEHIDGIVIAGEAVLGVWALLKAQQIATSVVEIGASVVALGANLVSLTGATAAQTVAQNALNVAQKATPWGAAIAGIAALTAGVIALVPRIKEWISNEDECAEAMLRWSSNVTSFSEQVSGCRAQIADISEVTGQYGHTVTEIDDLIAKGEGMVTDILRQANEENRQLRESEIVQIQEYNAKIAQLEQEKMGIYKNAQQDITVSIQAERELTQQELAQYAADIQAAEQQTREAIKSSYGQKATDINNYYREIGQYNSEAHLREIQANQEAMDRELEDSRAYSAQSLQLLTERAAAIVQNDVQMWASLDTSSRAGREQMISQLEQLDADAMNAFLTLAAQTKEAGGTLDANTQAMVKNILTNFKGLPKSMQDAGRDSLLGLIGGMKDQIPDLEKASEMTCDEIVDTVCGELQISSPSRVMYGIGSNTVQGAIEGMKSKSGALSTAATGISDSLVKGMTPEGAKVTGIGANAVSSVVTGLNNRVSGLNQKAAGISQGLVKNLTPSDKSVTGIGEHIMNGINAGMSDRQSWLGSKISSLASGIVEKFKSAFKINSPSKIMRDEIGSAIPEGIGVGIEQYADAATKPLRSLVEGMSGEGLERRLGDFSLDIHTRLEDHMSNVGSDGAMMAMFDRLAGSIEDLASRAIQLFVGDRQIALAVAGASDSVNGARLGFRDRGLTL